MQEVGLVNVPLKPSLGSLGLEFLRTPGFRILCRERKDLPGHFLLSFFSLINP